MGSPGTGDDIGLLPRFAARLSWALQVLSGIPASTHWTPEPPCPVCNLNVSPHVQCSLVDTSSFRGEPQLWAWVSA